MKQYQDLLKRIIVENTQEDGVHFDRETRSGDTAAIFGEGLCFDLRKGFPIVTTKRVPFKLVVGELLAFLSGKDDRRVLQEKSFGDFDENRWDIWKQDCERSCKEFPERFNGLNYGELYPTQWRNKYTGFTGKFDVIPEKIDLDADYVETKTGKHYTPKIFGVGYLGEYNCKEGSDWIYNTWRSMLERCYSKSCKSYSSYGAKGVTVSPRWHCYSNFAKDIYTLPNFQRKVDDSTWALDKDLYSGKVYSRNTCVFLPKDLNSKLTGTMLNYQGKYFLSISDFEEFIGTSKRGSLERALAKGAEVVTNPRLKPVLFIDQIATLVKNIKEDPMSRYLIVDAWNPLHNEHAVLGACHDFFQVFCTTDGYMDLMWHQRSVDTFLGLPFNIASYATLLTILAVSCGYRPRFLKAFLGDTHIYEKHFDQVLELLEREPRALPRLKLPEVKDKSNFFEYIDKVATDYELIDYTPHPSIKAPLLVGA